MIRLTKIGWDVFYSSEKLSERDYLESTLKYFDENSHFSTSEYWDGYRKYFDKRHRKFDFGHLSYVINKLIKKKINYTISGIDVDIFKPRLPYNKKLHLHQLSALYSFFDTKHGVIKVPTRGGKTYVASEAIRLILDQRADMPVLFFVDSQMLFTQAINDISGYLGIDKKEIGFINEGKFNIKQINVCKIQTIQSIFNGEKRIRKFKMVDKQKVDKTFQELKEERKRKREAKRNLMKFLESIGFLIVDECHEYSSDERMTVVKSTKNTEFNLLLSATPDKSEDKFVNITLRGIYGDILYEIPEKDLKDRGILAKDKIILLHINHSKNRNIDFSNINGYQDSVDKLIVNNKERNQIAINVIEICRKLQRKTLVLFSFREHGYNIAKITDDRYLTGYDKIGDRMMLKDQFLERKDGGVMLASNIFNKGLTLPEVEILYNIGGGKEQSQLIQKKGRVLGTTADKKRAMIIDFIDESDYFADHSLSRLEVYEKSVGIENIIVLNVYDDDFYTDLREQINQWFNDNI